MPATIQVVLQSDVENVGKSGDLARVRPGFARNFLIPRKLALPATTAAVNRINHEKAVAVSRTEKTKRESKDLASQIDGLVLVISQRAGEDKKLFGSVTTKDIEAAARAKGVYFDRKKIQLADPIRTLGKYDVPVRLISDVIATLKVEVIAK